MCLQYKSFENTVGKGEIARKEQFLLLPQCFLPTWRTFSSFHQIWNCRLQTLSVWKSLKFVIWERVNTYFCLASHNCHILVYVHACVCAFLCVSVCPTAQICLDKNFYINVWISKYVGRIVLLNELKCHLKLIFRMFKDSTSCPRITFDFLHVCCTNLLQLNRKRRN